MHTESQSTALSPDPAAPALAGWRRTIALIVAVLLCSLVLAAPAQAQEDQDDADATATEQPTTDDDVPAEPGDVAPADDAGSLRVVEDLNLRAEPSLDSEILAVMPAGSDVSPTAGADAEDDFLPVTFDGEEGWAYAAYLVSGGDNLATVEDEEGLNLRAEPNADAEVLLVMPTGAEVRVFGSAEDDDGTAWSRVRYEETTGWAATEFLVEGGAGDEAAETADEASEPADDEPTDSAAVDSDLAGQERIALDDLNLRTGPSADDEILVVIPAGGSLTLTGEGLEGGYVTATFDGTVGWVAAEFIARPDELETVPLAAATDAAAAEDETTATETAATDDATTVVAGETRVTLDELNLRAGASAEDEVVLVIPAGATVTLTDGGAENGYVAIEYDGATGWVAAEFLGE